MRPLTTGTSGSSVPVTTKVGCAHRIYGDELRGSPELVRKHLRHVRWSSDYGYYLQLVACRQALSIVNKQLNGCVFPRSRPY
jgi:hypothetical protein